MDEYISREAVFDEIRFQRELAESDGEASVVDTCDAMLHNLREIKAADVEPIKHGHWIRGKNKSAFPAKPSPIWYCSCCGEMIRYNDSMGTYQKKKKKVNEVNPRCRRCGTIMDGDSE